VNNVNNTGVNVNGLLAFVSGLLSFFTPCILPLVPSFLIYISGASITQASDLSNKAYSRKFLFHTLFFILGFSLVFISFGLSFSILGNLFRVYEKWIMRIGGVFLIVMGLSMLNIVRIPLLNREKMVHLNKKPAGFVGSFLVGLTFSLGWTPCIGPALAGILFVASTDSIFSGAYLLGLYSIGLAIPFFLAALLISQLIGFVQRWGHLVQYASRILAWLLIAIGVLLVTGYWKTVTSFLALS
jgi:cytochrome c-type biogenesis protein